jgi:TolA-binding protein
MMVNTEYRMTTAVASLCGFVMFTAGGCVMKSTYDAAVQNGLATKTELAQALEEQKTLTRHVSDMELLNADAVREAEAATAALQRAKDDAEYERQQIEQRIATLKQKLAQATKQQRSLQYELTVAKENTAALQELVDVNQRKVRDGAVATPAASTPEPAVHKPFDPSTIPVPQDLPAAPAVASQPPAPTPAPAPPVSRVRAPQPPPDEDWLTSIKNWLVSLWQSVFS